MANDKKEKKLVLGCIGGSGIYQMEGVRVKREHAVKTPFGDPSDKVIEADMAGRSVFFLPRHGIGHRYTPSEVNYRANIFALKALGVTHVIAISAVGIMQEHIKPGDMIIPNQIFDRTKGIRPSTFFGNGIVGHVSFADPFCKEFRQEIHQATLKHTESVHMGGAIVVMEGPAFSTRAESQHYRKALHPVAIGMTALPEAKLAREAEMAYGLLAMGTDYDCWNEDHGDVTVEAVIAVLTANAKTASHVIKSLAADLPTHWSCDCLHATQFAIMTRRDLIPKATIDQVKPLWGHYLCG